MLGKAQVNLFAVLLVGCIDKEGDSNDDLVGEESETETGDGDGTDDAGTLGDDTSGDDTSGDDTGGDCELGEYIRSDFLPWIDWEQASGFVGQAVTRSPFDSAHWVNAVFATYSDIEESWLCVEWLVGDADVGIDECSVYYTQGMGIVNDSPEPGFMDLAVDTATFDLGDGPVALEVWPGDELNPASYSSSFSSPPDGVPFGGVATLAATFDDLPALDLDLDVPEDILPIGPAAGSTMVTSAELASWTWSNSGGSEPIELEIDIASTPYGTGWSERVQIRCNVTDDGEFAFPSEYFGLAGERLGPELHAAGKITRVTRGQVPLAGANFHWQSINDVTIGVAIVD